MTNRDNFTSNVKKNLNKIKAQAQAMMSMEESVENEWANGGCVRCREEEENSEEEPVAPKRILRFEGSPMKGGSPMKSGREGVVFW